jgi:hypothetical protein
VLRQAMHRRMRPGGAGVRGIRVRHPVRL